MDLFNSELVRAWLRENRYSHREFAALACIGSATFERVLSGSAQPILPTLVAIARATGIQMNDLVMVERLGLGAHIREMRQRLRMTQADLAVAAHVDRHMLDAWESGQSEPPRARLPRLATALRCTVDELLDSNLHQAELPTAAPRRARKAS